MKAHKSWERLSVPPLLMQTFVRVTHVPWVSPHIKLCRLMLCILLKLWIEFLLKEKLGKTKTWENRWQAVFRRLGTSICLVVFYHSFQRTHNTQEIASSPQIHLLNFKPRDLRSGQISTRASIYIPNSQSVAFHER